MNRKLQRFEEVIPKKYHKKLVKLNYDFKNTKTFIVNDYAERRIRKIVYNDNLLTKIDDGINLIFNKGLIYFQNLDKLYHFQYHRLKENHEKLTLIDLTYNKVWIENYDINKRRSELWYGKMIDYMDFSKNMLFIINLSYLVRKFKAELFSFIYLKRMMLLLFSKHDFIDKRDGLPLLKTKQKSKKYDVIREDNIYNIDKCFFTTIEIGESTVSGFFRKQRYGTGRSKTRLIYIEKFSKKAYKRKAKKLSAGITKTL